MRRKYACDCTVKTADKPAQPIEKSTAGASMLAHVIVSKFADHQPLHRQERMFERSESDGMPERSERPSASLSRPSAVWTLFS